ncbi:hypothetical protein NLI96_g56 [Meripilus lineatus]|uniref:Uncharacterized protein n=1 Tax=Meripilus lineatus TaxID=2056292 RepID=A0AAD5YIU3_9APHY|nr:hypothetical protein NLI96_g56 [Physisporinus lineatus]
MADLSAHDPGMLNGQRILYDAKNIGPEDEIFVLSLPALHRVCDPGHVGAINRTNRHRTHFYPIAFEFLTKELCDQIGDPVQGRTELQYYREHEGARHEHGDSQGRSDPPVEQYAGHVEITMTRPEASVSIST